MNRQKIIELVMKLVDLARTSKGKRKIYREFPRKIKKTGGIQNLIQQLKVMYLYFKDPHTSKTKKGLIGAALLYFIMPFDVVSDLIPVLGLVDDGIAIAFVWSMVEKELRQYAQQLDSDIIDITSEVEIIEEEK
ncbi:YkvA family protein [Tepidibacillus infernus]|uniref:YkvA family protein n=1 Tax=Tepidibacillus infernus TaxID=1806172 RepID=UPI003B6CDD90